MRVYAGPGGRHPNPIECSARAAPLLPTRGRLAAGDAARKGGLTGEALLRQKLAASRASAAPHGGA
jgi:hypothetical protein